MPKTSSKDEIRYKVSKTLDIPQDGLKYKARKLQILIRQLDKFALKNVGQMPVQTYITLLTEFVNVTDQIKAQTKENHDTRAMAKIGDGRATEDLGAGTPAGEHSGVSTDNPFAGQGSDTVNPV